MGEPLGAERPVRRQDRFSEKRAEEAMDVSEKQGTHVGGGRGGDGVYSSSALGKLGVGLLLAEEQITGLRGRWGESADQFSDVPRTGHLSRGHYDGRWHSKTWVGFGTHRGSD